MQLASEWVFTGDFCKRSHGNRTIDHGMGYVSFTAQHTRAPAAYTQSTVNSIQYDTEQQDVG